MHGDCCCVLGHGGCLDVLGHEGYRDVLEHGDHRNAGEADGRRNPAAASHNLQCRQLVTHLECELFVRADCIAGCTLLMLGFDVWLRHPAPYNYTLTVKANSHPASKCLPMFTCTLG